MFILYITYDILASCHATEHTMAYVLAKPGCGNTALSHLYTLTKVGLFTSNYSYLPFTLKDFRSLHTIQLHMIVHSGSVSYTHLDVYKRQLYTSSYDFAESCVFDKQSLPPFLLYPTFGCPKQVMFLPKLHIQFAERCV